MLFFPENTINTLLRDRCSIIFHYLCNFFEKYLSDNRGFQANNKLEPEFKLPTYLKNSQDVSQVLRKPSTSLERWLLRKSNLIDWKYGISSFYLEAVTQIKKTQNKKLMAVVDTKFQKVDITYHHKWLKKCWDRKHYQTLFVICLRLFEYLSFSNQNLWKTI